MQRNTKKLTAALTLTLLLSVSTSFAKAPDFTVQVPYTGNGKPTTPQQDYYLYMNASWLKNAKIAPDEAIASTFVTVENKKDKQLLELTKQAIKHQAAGTATQDEKNIAKLYACIKDQQGREKAGLGDLAPMLQRIEKITSPQDYAETMAELCSHNESISAPLGDYAVINDLINNDNYIIALAEPASLSREQVENKNNTAFFTQYQDHISDVLQLYGRSKDAATKAAQAIFDLQKDLGQHSLTIAEGANLAKSIRKLDLVGVQKLYSHINAEAMLNAGGIGPKSGINTWYVHDPGLNARFNDLNTPELLPTLKDYTIYSVLDGYGILLDRKHQKLSTAFAKLATGAKAEASPEKLDADLNQQLLSRTYGRLYATTYFDEAHKNQVKSYIKLIIDHYRDKLQKLDWMTPATKKMALKKLDNMDINVGYPEAWQDYIDHFTIKSPQEGGNLINNVLAMSNQVAAWDRSRVGKPVRKDYWEDSTPQTINAFYNLLDNSINFPAAILQAPFFDAKADRETNLGGVGMFIGHEISHCFDNTGAQYDEQGRLRNWWQPSDYAEFKKRQDKIVAYYNRFLLPDGTRLNGEQTLTENTADLGGLNCITELIGPNPEGLRRAYQNFGIIWRSKATDRILQELLADIHSLSYVRVIGPLSTTDGFYKAYDVKPQDAMYVAPEDRVKLW